jgi:hypothetical protein
MMNWMTSAKKRIYKTKKQKDQQKRVAAKHKLGSSSSYQFPHRGNLSLAYPSNHDELHPNLPHNSNRIISPQTNKEEKPSTKKNLSLYNPMDEIVCSVRKHFLLIVFGLL